MSTLLSSAVKYLSGIKFSAGKILVVLLWLEPESAVFGSKFAIHCALTQSLCPVRLYLANFARVVKFLAWEVSIYCADILDQSTFIQLKHLSFYSHAIRPPGPAPRPPLHIIYKQDEMTVLMMSYGFRRGIKSKIHTSSRFEPSFDNKPGDRLCHEAKTPSLSKQFK